MKGRSLQPSGYFQQATRTRNIRTLYWYGEVKEESTKFSSLEQVKQDVKNGIVNSNLFDNCMYIDANDELAWVENMFFNLYCYNEYMYDIYATNRIKNFELILEQNGFSMTVEGEMPVEIGAKETIKRTSGEHSTGAI